MTNLVIQDELAERLEAIAQRENRSLEAVLAALIDLYASLPEHFMTLSEVSPTDSLTAMDGMFDDEITDLSTTVRETMDTYYQKKYGRPG